MIQKALFKQIALFFVAPLMVAIVHSVFGIQFCTYIISTFGKQKFITINYSYGYLYHFDLWWLYDGDVLFKSSYVKRLRRCLRHLLFCMFFSYV